MNWLGFWLEQWPGFVVGVVSSLSAAAIGALLKRAYPALKKRACKAAAASRIAVSKVLTSLGEISFLDAAKKRLIAFTQVVAGGVSTLAVFCLWVFMIHYQVSRIGGRASTLHAEPATISDYGTCYCPTPAGGSYTGGEIEPVRRVRSSTRDCAQPYGGPPQYSVLSSTESAPALGCSPARKGGKLKRTLRPCAAEDHRVTSILGTDGSEYGFVSDIR